MGEHCPRCGELKEHGSDQLCFACEREAQTSEANDDTFGDFLAKGPWYDGDLIIGGVDMPASFVWDSAISMTEYGKEKFRPIMDAKFTVLPNGNIEIHCDDDELGELFVWAAAGYISDREYRKIFATQY